MADDLYDVDPDTVGIQKPNTGLAQKVALQEQAKKNALRELFNRPTKHDALEVLAENKAITPQNTDAGDFKPPNTGLAEKMAAKAKAEKDTLLEFLKRGKPANKPVAKPIVEDVKEHEPENLSWSPVTPMMLSALYPKSSAVSDLWQMIAAAVQQPGKGFALVAPQGTKILIKASVDGALTMAMPDKDPKIFTNPTSSPDLDMDADDKDRHTAIAPESGEVRESKKPFVPENNKALYHKIISVADSIRKGNVQTDNSLNELPLTPKKQLYENKVKKVNLKELNNLLYNIQDLLSYRTSPSLDRLAVDVSNVIAEALLSDNDAVPQTIYENLKTKFNTIKRK